MTLRAKRTALIATCLIGLAGVFIRSSLDTADYRVLACDNRYSISNFKLSRGRDHDMWDADPAEIAFSRWLGSRDWTRRIRFKLLAPMSWFRTKTPEPSLAFIVRLKGEMSDADLAGLSAQLLSGTNVYDLRDQASDRNWSKHSIIKCWRMESTPATNAALELQIKFASGAQLAGIAIPSNRAEFQPPLVAQQGRRAYVADLLHSFLDGRAHAKETIMNLHAVYEEYKAPDYLTPFEMIYYDHYAPGSGNSGANPEDRLREEAREWLKVEPVESGAGSE